MASPHNYEIRAANMHNQSEFKSTKKWNLCIKDCFLFDQYFFFLSFFLHHAYTLIQIQIRILGKFENKLQTIFLWFVKLHFFIVSAEYGSREFFHLFPQFFLNLFITQADIFLICQLKYIMYIVWSSFLRKIWSVVIWNAFIVHHSTDS